MTGGSGSSGDGGPATSALFGGLYGIAVDSAENLYISDFGNNRLRVVNAAGIIRTAAGARNFADAGRAGRLPARIWSLRT